MTASPPIALCRLMIIVGVLLVAYPRDVCGQGTDESVEIILPLRDGRFLSLRDVERAFPGVFKSASATGGSASGQIEIPPLAAEMIELMELTKVLPKGAIRIEKHRIVLATGDAAEAQRRFQSLLEKLGGANTGDLDTKGLFRPKSFDPARRTIVFVHGLASNGQGTFADFMAQCDANRINAVTFDYPNYGSIAQSGNLLARELRQFAAEFPRTRIVIVAHSMGGLVARHALEVAVAPASLTTDLVTIGTPHEGSLLAECGHVLRLAEALIAVPTPTEFLAEGLSEACRDLNPGSDFLRRLAKARRAPGVRYHLVAGKRAPLTKKDLDVFTKEARRIGIHRLGWTVKEADRVAGNLSELDEVVNGLGDGVVALRRAKLAGAASEKTFDLDHLALIRGRDCDPVWNHIVTILQWQK